VTIRPATVCGYSPRQRLDLSVNILTNHAVTNNRITVFGGSQLRPNLHIQDMADAYQMLLEVPDESIRGRTFNIGSQNLSIAEIAQIVRREVETAYPEKRPIEIVTAGSDDPRSYHVNSDRVRKTLGFVPRRTVVDAVRDLCDAFSVGKLPNPMDDDRYYNVRTMKALELR
jgi:nucleoside-diphosphate-sugar epimerase